MPIKLPIGPSGRVTFRGVAVAAVVSTLVGGASTVLGTAEPGSPVAPTATAEHHFVTRPDLVPPMVDVRTPATGTEPGSVFLAPINPSTMGIGADSQVAGQPGPLIVDDAGQPVWFAPTAQGAAMGLEVQQYQSKPVLTWFEGSVIVPPGLGRGEYVILDESYREVARVAAGNGLRADLHDMVITPQNTALLLAYRDVQRDLTGIGGPADATVTEGVVQEIDIASGDVLFEWHSLDHVGEGESFLPLPEDPAEPWDYFHVNSVELDGDGGLLLSARNTHAVYRIDRGTGAVHWRLNGKKSDFRMGEGTGFEWQHDARRQEDGTLTVFDNGAKPKDRSRGLVLDVDEQARTTELVRADNRSEAQLSPNMGNYQALGNGHAFTGWGGAPGFTEFGPDGTVLFDATVSGGMASYRSFRAPWVGRPLDLPVAAGVFGEGESTNVYASWNGATEVRGWRVLAGPDPASLQPVQEAARSGFETAVEIPGRQAYVAVEALGASGEVLGTSEPVQIVG